VQHGHPQQGQREQHEVERDAGNGQGSLQVFLFGKAAIIRAGPAVILW
jgi:hypothetical protein